MPPLASSSPADRWSRSALWAPSSAKDAMPLSFLWDGLRRGSGVGSTTWNQELGPTWASLSWREPGRAGKGSHTHGCCVESIPASKVVAWWDVDSLIFGDLSVIAFCLGLRDRETQLQEVATILSLSWLLHGTKLRWWTLSVCKAPSLLHTFVLNTAGATTHFLFHCFVLPENCYLNPYSLPLSLSYQKQQEKGDWFIWSLISSQC